MTGPVAGKNVVGYTNRFSVLPGDALTVRLSSTTARVRLSLHQVATTGWDENGASVTTRPVDWFKPRPIAAQAHPVPFGSCALAPFPTVLGDGGPVTLGVVVQPTARQPRDQVIAEFRNAQGVVLASLRIGSDGHFATHDRSGVLLVRSAAPLVRGRWLALAASFFGAGKGQIATAPLFGVADCRTGVAPPGEIAPAASLSLAAGWAKGRARAPFDGRLSAPVLTRAGAGATAQALAQGPHGWRALAEKGADQILARWDFTPGTVRNTDPNTAADLGPGRCHARLVNSPTRAVTGPFWDGTVFDWRQRPDHYDAIHFHADDLADCNWPDAAVIDVPGGAVSGLYAVGLETDAGRDLIPFVIRAPHAARARVAMLLPTFTYLSYANAPPDMRGPDIGPLDMPDEGGVSGQAGFGRSHYERHADGSPVMLSSPLRPLTSVRFQTRPWGIVVDGWVLGWLRQQVEQVDLLCDQDLHRDGLQALAGYDVVVTGNHPEYYSAEMLNALDAFTDGGGRLMYLGGNGFYWRVTVSDSPAGQIEVRRTEDGTRAWIAAPGEGHHMMDGAYGGLWRRLGRAPNLLAGVGFAAQGFDESGFYAVNDQSRSGPVAFALAGVGPRFGQHGWLGGGAAGQEIDRADARLATTERLYVLARSIGHPPSMLRTKEEMLSTTLPFNDRNARSDVVIRFAGSAGAVFSTGSMAWAGALLDRAGDDNHVSRLTANVLARFLNPEPFAP